MSDGARNNKWIWWIAAGAVVVLILGGLWLTFAWKVVAFVDLEDEGRATAAQSELDERTASSVAELEAPPSERGAEPSDTAPGSYDDLQCSFSGVSELDPGLTMNPDASSTQRMTLADGSAFVCDGPSGTTAGSVELDATFDALSIMAGSAKGTGRIQWSELPPEALALAGPPPLASNTTTEVELDFPVIIVWMTIDDGPYTGFKGKLVLDDWELVRDARGVVVGVEFRPTDFALTSPASIANPMP